MGFESEVHPNAIVANGQCNYDPVLGFYVAECDDANEDQESVNFFLRKTFCHDNTCQDCATPEDVSRAAFVSGKSGIGPVFLSQEKIHAVCDVAPSVCPEAMYLEISGNCFSMDICRQISSSSSSSSSSRIS